MAHAFAKVIEAALGLPEVEQATSYGTPALKVRKKLLCRVKDADTIVVMCPVEEKELLMEAAPALYFQTDHYKNWPSMLIRIRAIPRRTAQMAGACLPDAGTKDARKEVERRLA